jgi:mannosylglycoprotein endo-beta-mannosidase
VYDLFSQRVWRKESVVNISPDGVVNDVFVIEFPENISNVHFIKLRLLDEKGRQVGDNFYWRSTNRYEKGNTLTGPATAGFQDINKLPAAKIKAVYKTAVEKDVHYIHLNLKNTDKSLAFFTQVQWLDKKGKPVRPSFYSNNFVNLLPNENILIEIETAMDLLTENEYTLVVKGFNQQKQKFNIKIER